jgi:hypothetical protein
MTAGWIRALVFIFLLSLAPGAGGAQDRLADSRYYTYDEIMALFDQWAALYPQIFHREIIGYTDVGNEPIWAAKISDRASQHDPEARLLFSAAQHANEPNGTGAIMLMMDRLLSNYGLGGTYQDMVDNLEFWFVPIVNIEGHRITFSDDPYWQVWRKTQRDNDGNGQVQYPVDGVDPNRNWDFRWEECTETSYSSSRYKGPYPFSESCIVALRDLILRERPLFVTDLHSPDQAGMGNKIWWCWWSNESGPGIDADIYSPICQALASRCQTEVDGVYVNGTVASYNTLPKEQCWVYANTGICTYLYEISNQLWWTGAMVDTVAHRAGRGLFYLGERAMDGPGLKGRVTSAYGGEPLVAEVVVQQVHDATIGPRMTEQFQGRYWRLLNAGSYTVTVSAPDHFPQTQAIYVGASGWTALNFQLTRDPAGIAQVEPTGIGRLWCDVPLTPGGMIHFELPREAEVSLSLVDTAGRQVQELASGYFLPGVRSYNVNRNLPCGSYLLRLRSGQDQLVKKVIVLN